MNNIKKTLVVALVGAAIGVAHGVVCYSEAPVPLCRIYGSQHPLKGGGLQKSEDLVTHCRETWWWYWYCTDGTQKYKLSEEEHAAMSCSSANILCY